MSDRRALAIAGQEWPSRKLPSDMHAIALALPSMRSQRWRDRFSAGT